MSSESDTRQHVLSTGPQCGVPPPTPLQPMNLPPPNIPPPNLLPTMTQIPPSIMPIPASQTIVVSVPNASNVPNVPNVPPPNVIPSVMMSAPPPVHNVPSSINSVPPPNLNIPPPNVPPPSLIQNAGPPPPLSLMSTSYPLPNQVAQVPMGPPNIQVPPPVRPLTGLRASEQLGTICRLFSFNFFISTYRRVFTFMKNKLFPIKKRITCSRNPQYACVCARAIRRIQDNRGQIRNLRKAKFVQD